MSLSQFIIGAICTVSVNYESVLVANRCYLSLLSVQFAQFIIGLGKL